MRALFMVLLVGFLCAGYVTMVELSNTQDIVYKVLTK